MWTAKTWTQSNMGIVYGTSAPLNLDTATFAQIHDAFTGVASAEVNPGMKSLFGTYGVFP